MTLLPVTLNISFPAPADTLVGYLKYIVINLTIADLGLKCYFQSLTFYDDLHFYTLFPLIVAIFILAYVQWHRGKKG